MTIPVESNEGGSVEPPPRLPAFPPSSSFSSSSNSPPGTPDGPPTAAHPLPSGLSWTWSEGSSTLTFFVNGRKQRVSTLPVKDVVQLMQAMLELPEAEIQRVVQEADTDGDGLLTVKQW
eukprot:RCo046553